MQQAWINASRLAASPVARSTTEVATSNTEDLPISGLKRKTDESDPQGSSKRVKLGV